MGDCCSFDLFHFGRPLSTALDFSSELAPAFVKVVGTVGGWAAGLVDGVGGTQRCCLH